MEESKHVPAPERTDRGRIPIAVRILATGCFTGYIPFASGTFGSLAGLLVYLLPGVSSPPVLAGLIAAGFFAGRAAAGRMAAALGHALHADAAMLKGAFQPGDDRHPDPSVVVIDEIVGVWVALLLLPVEFPAVIIAFTTFRLFDILKPPPARQLEKYPHGWGIMLDDIAAGVYANLVTRLILGIL